MPTDFLPPFANAEVRESYQALVELMKQAESLENQEMAIQNEIESLQQSNSLVAEELRCSQSLV